MSVLCSWLSALLFCCVLHSPCASVIVSVPHHALWDECVAVRKYILTRCVLIPKITMLDLNQTVTAYDNMSWQHADLSDTHTRTPTHTHAHAHARMHAHTHTTHGCTDRYTQTHTDTYKNTHARVQTRKHTHTHMPASRRAHTFTHTTPFTSWGTMQDIVHPFVHQSFHHSFIN